MKSLKSKYLLLSILFIGLIFSCKRENETIPDKLLYYSYFPINQGNEYIYQADSIYFNSFKNSNDTLRYQIRLVVDTSFKDNVNETAYKIFQYTRDDSTKAWDKLRVYYWKRTATQAQKVIENIRYIALSFPIEEGKRWNGNLLNTVDSYGLYDYNYLNVHKPLTIGKFNFDSTVKVVQINQKDALENQYADEIYANRVGMVSKTVLDTSFSRIHLGIKVTKGGILTLKLIDYKVK